MNKKITYFIKNKKYYRENKEIPVETIRKELKKYQIDKLEKEKKVNIVIKAAKLDNQKKEEPEKNTIKRYRNEEQYRFMVDNPKELIGVDVYVNDGLHGRVDKIIKKDPPYTIFNIKYDNAIGDKE